MVSLVLAESHLSKVPNFYYIYSCQTTNIILFHTWSHLFSIFYCIDVMSLFPESNLRAWLINFPVDNHQKSAR